MTLEESLEEQKALAHPLTQHVLVTHFGAQVYSPTKVLAVLREWAGTSIWRTAAMQWKQRAQRAEQLLIEAEARLALFEKQSTRLVS